MRLYASVPHPLQRPASMETQCMKFPWLFLCLFGALTGCHSFHWRNPAAHRLSAQLSQLAGTAWSAEDIEGARVLNGIDSTLEFELGGAIAGSTGCNLYVGEITVERQSIRFGEVMTAETECSPNSLQQEHRYINALAAVRRIRIDTDQLWLTDEDSHVLIRMQKLPDLRWSFSSEMQRGPMR